MQSNPENTVGILTMAGKGVRVLVTPTSDLGKILASVHGMFSVGALPFVGSFIGLGDHANVLYPSLELVPGLLPFLLIFSRS